MMANMCSLHSAVGWKPSQHFVCWSRRMKIAIIAHNNVIKEYYFALLMFVFVRPLWLDTETLDS